MKIFFAPEQLLHEQKVEFNRGELVPPYETGKRAQAVFEALQLAYPGQDADVDIFGLSHILNVHDADYIDFLKRAHEEWVLDGRVGDAFPMVWPVHGMRANKAINSIVGKISNFSFEISTGITAHSWVSAQRSADIALCGAREIASGAHSAFSLCRPPGHHAGRDFFGGYCFLNNAAIAAEYLCDNRKRRIAILDVDYHHGNGTQSIFFDRADVLYASIHADPDTDFPYFLGYADEKGERAGEGTNLNIPLARGTAWLAYEEALLHALNRIENFAPDMLVVSLGVDTSAGDLLSSFQLERDDYTRMGAAISRLGLQTLFVFEGGYAIDEIGGNVVRVLNGFHDH